MTKSPNKSFDYSKDVAPSFVDDRLDAPAFHRNKDAIAKVLRSLPAGGQVNLLEVASGTGQHAAYIANTWPQVSWWPSDLIDVHIKSIDAWAQATETQNVKPAALLDVTNTEWLEGGPLNGWPTTFDIMIAANMIHIAPWEVALGLLAGAGIRLSRGGYLVIYGPFKQNGQHSAPGNAEFDASLKSRDSSWGVRDIDDVTKAATANGLTLRETVEMPANNLCIIFQR